MSIHDRSPGFDTLAFESSGQLAAFFRFLWLQGSAQSRAVANLEICRIDTHGDDRWTKAFCVSIPQGSRPHSSPNIPTRTSPQSKTPTFSHHNPCYYCSCFRLWKVDKRAVGRRRFDFTSSKGVSNLSIAHTRIVDQSRQRAKGCLCTAYTAYICIMESRHSKVFVAVERKGLTALRVGRAIVNRKEAKLGIVS